MIRNYLLIAYRNLIRHKAFSLINIIGLTVGMACCFLILLFVQHELSYDRFHEKADRIYRVTYLPKFAGLPRPLAVLPPPAAPRMPGYFPEIEYAARLYNRNAVVMLPREGGAPEKFAEERFYFADSTLLDIFTFQFLQGDKKTALKDRFNVVITDEIAEKYFGKNWQSEGRALGKTLVFEGREPMRITGIVRAFPSNSHLHFNFLSSYETMFALENAAARENLNQNWIISHSLTYVLLKPNQSAEKVKAKFPAFLKKYANPQFSKDIEYGLQPLLDIHLRSELMAEPEPVGSMTYVYVFLGIAFVTLLIACINFINLSTARSLKRAREVGMRKVLGAEKRQLIGQFLGESFLMSGLAFLLSLALMTLLLPTLNQLTEKKLTMSDLLHDPVLMLGFIGVFLLTGALAGSYPAFFVTKFQPVETLKGNFTSGKAKGGVLRQALVVVQFTASIALVVGAMVTLRQLNYMRNQPLGFAKDYVITASLVSQNLNNIFTPPNDSLYLRLKTFARELQQNPDVQAVALSDAPLGLGGVRRGIIPEGFTAENNLFITCVAVDENFLDAYGLQVLAGRNFSPSIESDKNNAFLINETGARSFGWKTPREAIGKNINREGKQGKIIGVIKDFHNESLRRPIEGVLLDINRPVLNLYSMKINAARATQTLDFIRNRWNAFFPDKVFEFQFLDQTISRQYEQDERLGRMISYFAGLAIFISCLGLYGLVSLVVQQRTREIGIRKVLGASVSSIVYLLAKNFALLVAISFLIAAPLAYYFAHQWLQEFNYRIDLSWWLFGLAGLLALLIALVTVGLRAVHAAQSNPTQSLRAE